MHRHKHVGWVMHPTLEMVAEIFGDEFEISFDTKGSNCSSCSYDHNCNEKNSCESCIFLCKWFSIKNKFLIKELSALQDYLQSIPNSMFLTKIIIRVKSENPEILGQKQFSYLKTFVDY